MKDQKRTNDVTQFDTSQMNKGCQCSMVKCRTNFAGVENARMENVGAKHQGRKMSE